MRMPFQYNNQSEIDDTQTHFQYNNQSEIDDHTDTFSV